MMVICNVIQIHAADETLLPSNSKPKEGQYCKVNFTVTTVSATSIKAYLNSGGAKAITTKGNKALKKIVFHGYGYETNSTTHGSVYFNTGTWSTKYNGTASNPYKHTTTWVASDTTTTSLDHVYIPSSTGNNSDQGVYYTKIEFYYYDIISGEDKAHGNMNEVIEVCGVQWAKGNLQYVTGYGDPNFYNNNFKIAPYQWHFHDYNMSSLDGGSSSLSSNFVDYFNWGVLGSNSHSITDNFSTTSLKPIIGKMYDTADGANEVSQFDQAKYGDIAYWASSGYYQLPSRSDFVKILENASIKYGYYKKDGCNIYGVLFTNPIGEREVILDDPVLISDAELNTGLFLPYSGYRKREVSDVLNIGIEGTYLCANDDNSEAVNLWMVGNVIDNIRDNYARPNHGFSIRPVISANSSTVIGTCNNGGMLSIGEKNYIDNYFRHSIFEQNGACNVTVNCFLGYNSLVVYNGVIGDIQSLSYTGRHELNYLMIIFYNNNDLITWNSDQFTVNDFNPQWTCHAAGYEVEADLSSLDSSIGNHTATIPFTFSRHGLSATVNVEYSYNITDASVVSPDDYELTSQPSVVTNAHQATPIVFSLKNPADIKGIEFDIATSTWLNATGTVTVKTGAAEPRSVDFVSQPVFTLTDRFIGGEMDETKWMYLFGQTDLVEYPNMLNGTVTEKGLDGTVAIHMGEEVQTEEGIVVKEYLEASEGELFAINLYPLISGDHSINISNVKLTLVDGTVVELDPFTINVKANRVPGDLNDDGVVDENDVPGGKRVINIALSSGNIVDGLVNTETLIPINLQNNTEVTSFSVTIKLHENIEMVGDLESFISAGERGENFDFSATQNDDGTITIAGTATTPLEAGEGPVLNLKVKTAWQNTYTIPVTNMTVTTADGTVKQLPDCETRLIMQGVRGDMNGDGRVDLSDALYIINLATGLAE